MLPKNRETHEVNLQLAADFIKENSLPASIAFKAKAAMERAYVRAFYSSLEEHYYYSLACLNDVSTGKKSINLPNIKDFLKAWASIPPLLREHYVSENIISRPTAELAKLLIKVIPDWDDPNIRSYP